MSVIALSLPEMIILREVLTVRLLIMFVAIVGVGILAVGYLFNALFGCVVTKTTPFQFHLGIQ